MTTNKTVKQIMPLGNFQKKTGVKLKNTVLLAIRHCRKIIFLPVFIIYAIEYANAATHVENIRSSDYSNYTRLVIELNSSPEQYDIFTLENPARIVIDIKEGKWEHILPKQKAMQRISDVRHAQKSKENILRIVLDISTPLFTIEHFYLAKNANNPDRIVVDIMDENLAKNTVPSPVVKGLYDSKENIPAPKIKPESLHKKIIVLDAGHGGKDPGASGRRKTLEKNITLTQARILKKYLEKTGRYKVFMTRNNDIYIPLQKRVALARKYNADIFISLHADSHKNPRINGMSIYTLSDSASDKEAAALARKENKSDIIAGIDLNHEDDEISKILIDLVQRDTMNMSAVLAENIAKTAKHKIKLLPNAHRFAGFRVLTAAEIPSVLIELGYLSNRQEEKLLTSENYQQTLAEIITKAIDIHFNNS